MATLLSFTQFMEERKVDPEALANRTARRYGKKTSFGKWEKTERGGHIPLSTFDARKSNAAGTRMYNVQKKLGYGAKDKETHNAAKQKFDSLHTKTTMKISDLKATQPFVRTNDPEKLKAKIANKEPDHIHVVTHKGEHYIADGHHAVMAAHLRGEKEVHVSHVNLDNVK